MTEHTLDQLLESFSPERREMVMDAVRRTGAHYLVLFENVDFCSSRFGHQTILCVGPTCTYKSPEECEGQHLNDLPSQRQYPRGFARVKETT